ncbi:MAG TPA: transporter substrate-binding domain-containing protein, partial [Blastocatellia bacterium]|nr:transporter substrate-binding domain-containing protein [Blastocatellia bacterium]
MNLVRKITEQTEITERTEKDESRIPFIQLFPFVPLSLLLIFLLAFPVRAQDLRWGGDAEGGAPYLLPDPKNPRRIIGFEIDLMDALGKQLKRKSVFVQNQWDGLIPGLQRGSYELAVNGIEITDDR